MGVIYLVRHGQAEASAYGVLPSGGAATEPDPAIEPGSLTATGRMQADVTGAVLAEQVSGFTAAISGDLPRQRQTLTAILGHFDHAPTPVVDSNWNEYTLPTLVGDTTADEYADNRGFQARLDQGLTQWITQSGDNPDEIDGPESYAAFRGRVSDAALRAADLAGSGQTVLVVSSAGAITQWIADLWHVPPHRWPMLSRAMVNASFSKLIVGRRGVSVVSVNEHAHLDDRDGGLATFR